METSTFDTTDSEAEDYTLGKRKRMRVGHSSCESSDDTDAASSPAFKRPIPMKLAKTSKPSKSASKSTLETAARKLDYAESRRTPDAGRTHTTATSSSLSESVSSPHTGSVSSPCASDAALPLAGIQ